MKCKICEQRTPRRYCPGVKGDICSICCGNEREQSIDCPLSCPYLREAHDHERLPDFNPEQMPNKDIDLPEEFARDNPSLLHVILAMIYRAATDVPEAIDSDVQEAIESMIHTLRTLQSGLYYDSKPQNPIAASIYLKIKTDLEELRKHFEEEAVKMPDAMVITAFVYAQREALARNNGRRKCRAFLEILDRIFPDQMPVESVPSLIVP